MRSTERTRAFMTATRSALATFVVVVLIAVGFFVWQQTRSSCPDDFGPGQNYAANDEVTFAGNVWKAKVAGSTEVPGPSAKDWTAAGTC
jgi:hypothetical protein